MAPGPATRAVLAQLRGPTTAGTRIDVHVALPDSEADRLDDKSENITTSLARLATLAKAAATS